MSISSPVPVLQGDKGTELRSTGEELLLRRPDSELRIPLAAIARVRAERRDLAVELTAPAGVEPTVYRVTDVSAAAAGVFADAVNAALPERAAEEETVDGSALVVNRSLVIGDDEEDAEENEVRGGMPSHGKGVMYTACAAVAVLAVVVGVLGGDWSRAIATLLLGVAGVSLTWFAAMMCAMAWREWYLPRYGITVEGRQIFWEDEGRTVQTFTATDGVIRYIHGHAKGKTVRIAYHPRNPMFAIPCSSTGDRVLTVVFSLVVVAVAGLMDYGTYELVFPVFTD
ncbi:hypothetical protein [Streptomyces sp. NPDC126499]|uniref:hypothetical protein n=1 Tax=Streptomyces sp. NPDC126499 TaxID=3155314 RepID=UPI003320F730